MIDGTLACEDATQNLLRLWLLLMLMLRNVLTTVCCRFGSWSFGHKIEFLFRLWAQGSGEILKLNFGQYFAADAWLRLWSSILVEIPKLGLVKIMKFKFSRNAEIWLRFWSWCLVDILEMKFDQNLCKNFDMTKEVILVSRTQPSGPLCLWQCLFLSEMWLPRRCFSHARDTCLVD